MSADRPLVESLPSRQRARITNGAYLDGIDGRSAEARRFRDVLGQIVADLGGPAILSEGQRQLARRCALLSVECEKLEAISVRGEPIDLDIYGTLTNRLGRCFQGLGLRGVPKNVTPDLRDYLAEHLDGEVA